MDEGGIEKLFAVLMQTARGRRVASPQGSTKEVDCLLPAVFLNNPTVGPHPIYDLFRAASLSD